MELSADAERCGPELCPGDVIRLSPKHSWTVEILAIRDYGGSPYIIGWAKHDRPTGRCGEWGHFVSLLDRHEPGWYLETSASVAA